MHYSYALLLVYLQLNNKQGLICIYHKALMYIDNWYTCIQFSSQSNNKHIFPGTCASKTEPCIITHKKTGFVFLVLSGNPTKLFKHCIHVWTTKESNTIHSPVCHVCPVSMSSKFRLKVAYTSGPIFEKIMKRYPIFSLQIINYQIDLKHK